MHQDFKYKINKKPLWLWLVCMVMFFNFIFVYEDQASIPNPAFEKKRSNSGYLIPSLFPKRIIHFHPIETLQENHQPGDLEKLYGKIILRASKRYKIDSAMVKAIIMVESGYHPFAVSKKGAQGLMQLMPRTARHLGVEDSFNPEQNINAGVKYFKRLLRKCRGDVRLALAAYNAGISNVKKYKGVPPFPATRFYIRKVLKYRRIYKNHKQKPVA